MEQLEAHGAVTARRSRGARLAAALLLALAAAAGLHMVRRTSFLLFHSLVELAAVIIASGVFMVTWNARRILSRDYLLVVGVGYAGVAAVDLTHMLAYKGMGVVAAESANLATQLWIAARYLEAATLLAAPLFLRRRVDPHGAAAVVAAVVAAALLAIVAGVFPACFVEGTGLTTFKVVSEYVIAAMLAAAAVWLYRERREFEPSVVTLILVSIGVTIVSELMFTLYTDPYGLANEAGHILKVGSFYLLYKATVEAALTRPYGNLFRELKQREEALERSNHELEVYAHTVSHDLRSPLSVVVTSAEVLARLAERGQLDGAGEKARQLTRTIESSARKAVSLADDILTLAAAGQKPSEVDDVDIAAVVARVLDERAETIRARHVRVDIAGRLGRVRASPTHMYQLFSNLIGNAIRHNDRQDPIVRIARLDDGSPAHRFRVCDNGPGIPPELLDKLFTPFAKGPRGGHGLGLSTVDRIVRVYGGWIRVSNAGGACFELELRDLRGAEGPPAPARDAEQRPGGR